MVRRAGLASDHRKDMIDQVPSPNYYQSGRKFDRVGRVSNRKNSASNSDDSENQIGKYPHVVRDVRLN